MNYHFMSSAVRNEQASRLKTLIKILSCLRKALPFSNVHLRVLFLKIKLGVSKLLLKFKFFFQRVKNHIWFIGMQINGTEDILFPFNHLGGAFRITG